MPTKKPRTPRKRPNQTYNEAATILNTAYPTLFDKPRSVFTKQTTTETNESSEVLLPIKPYDPSSFILQPVQHKPSFSNFQTETNSVFHMQQKFCKQVIDSREMDDEDFDCESMLDEEMDHGIDSIMGMSRVEEESNGDCERENIPWFGFRREVKALRHRNGNMWNIPAMEIIEISSGIKNPHAKTKRKRVVERLNVEMKDLDFVKGNSIRKSMLRLNYDEVQDAWSDQGSPFANRHCVCFFGNS